MKPIRILLADDHTLMRQGLRALLERQEGLSVVAEAADGHEALEQATAVRPDIAIIDIGMSNLNGIEATRRITEKHPETAVIILSMHADEGLRPPRAHFRRSRISAERFPGAGPDQRHPRRKTGQSILQPGDQPDAGRRLHAPRCGSVAWMIAMSCSPRVKRRFCRCSAKANRTRRSRRG